MRRIREERERSIRRQERADRLRHALPVPPLLAHLEPHHALLLRLPVVLDPHRAPGRADEGELRGDVRGHVEVARRAGEVRRAAAAGQGEARDLADARGGVVEGADDERGDGRGGRRGDADDVLELRVVLQRLLVLREYGAEVERLGGAGRGQRGGQRVDAEDDALAGGPEEDEVSVMGIYFDPNVGVWLGARVSTAGAEERNGDDALACALGPPIVRLWT